MQKLKTLTYSVLIGLTLAAGITFAAWATSTWNDTNTWISDGATISAQKIAENFEYLLALNGDLCTTHNANSVRYASSTLEYCDGSGWVSVDTNTYAWSSGAWGSCTSDGGGGYEKARTVECKDESSVVVSNSLCTGTEPTSTEACTTIVYDAPSGGFKECGGTGGQSNTQKAGGTLLCAGKKEGNVFELNTASVMCENRSHSIAVDQALVDYGSNQYAWWDSYTTFADVWGLDYSCSGCSTEHISQITCLE